MPHGSQTPGSNRNGVADFCPVLVDQPTKDKQTHPIGSLKSGVHHTKLRIGPVKLVVEDRLEQGKNLPVDIVDCGGKEQKAAYSPTMPD